MIKSLLDSLFGRPYTIGELLNIDAARQQKSLMCTVRLEDSFFTIQKEGIFSKFRSLFTGPTITSVYMTLKFSVISDTGNAHTVYIQLDPDYSMTKWMTNRVKIYCDCKDFMYRSAYLLNKRKSIFLNDRLKLQLGQSLTDIPKRKSLTLLCKHSFAALNWLMSNYSTIMSTL